MKVYYASDLSMETYSDKLLLPGNILMCSDDVFESSIQDSVQRFGVPKYFVFDSYPNAEFNNFGKPVFYINDWWEFDLKQISQQPFYACTQVKTDYAVNFCVNKKKLTRYILIKLVEIFDLDCNYTWSGSGRNTDCHRIIKEKENLHDKIIDRYFSQILKPISEQFEPKWIGQGTLLDSSLDSDAYSILDYGTNQSSWNDGLWRVFNRSAVSLIGESINIDNSVNFTEKTSYAILGLTFPIFVGGKNQAIEFKKYGFDTFDDIFNHDYQAMNTVLERCFYAVYLNLKLLKNKTKLAELRLRHKNRLLQNQRLMCFDHIKKYNDNILDQWPTDVRQSVEPYLYRSRQ